MAEYHRVIGIDLGTTFSVVAVYALGKEELIVIPNQSGNSKTPSVIYIDKNGQMEVGEAARRRLTRDPGGVVIEAKRVMGERNDQGAKTMVRAGTRLLDPEFVSACILKELKGCAERFIGEPIHDAVITVPAYFKESQKNATREAASIAGLNARLLVNEPTAAAVAYGISSDDDISFIVYDFGGGTFDVSVVRATGGKDFEVVGTGGDSRLGGGDIDQAIIDWVLANMRKEFGRDFSGESKLVGRIRLKAEEVKIDLCNSGQTKDFFLDNLGDGIDEINYLFTTDDFKRIIRPLIDRTLKEVDVALASARANHRVTLDDIDSFVLVGGSSRIPFVRQALNERFQKPIRSDLNPDEIVAIGAARLAAGYPPSTGVNLEDNRELTIDESAASPLPLEGNVIDVVSHTLGIGLKDDVYDPLIMKDSPIPAKITREGYTTAQEGQTSIFVPVYQGDNPRASQNYQLGDVVIDELAPAPAGTHRFDVTFTLDGDGIFVGSILHRQTGKERPIHLQRGQGELTKKRRQELTVALNSGIVPDSPTSAHPSLEEQARLALRNLPSPDKEKLEELLRRLTFAKDRSDSSDESLVALEIKTILARHNV